MLAYRFCTPLSPNRVIVILYMGSGTLHFNHVLHDLCISLVLPIFSHVYTGQDWTRQHQPLSIALRESESVCARERGWWWAIDLKIAAGDLTARVTSGHGAGFARSPGLTGRNGHVERSYGNGRKLLPACPCLCGLTRDRLCFKPIT